MGFFIVQLQNYQSEAHYAAKPKNGADMNLQPNECDQFYRIWWSLLSYVNKQMKLFNDFPSQLENDNLNPASPKYRAASPVFYFRIL